MSTLSTHFVLASLLIQLSLSSLLLLSIPTVTSAFCALLDHTSCASLAIYRNTLRAPTPRPEPTTICCRCIKEAHVSIIATAVYITNGLP